MVMSSGTDARVTVYNTVVNWLARKVRLKPSQIRVGRTFSGKPPDGYGQVQGSFMTMCDEISATLSVTTGRALTLPTAWRIKHKDDVIADFINAVAALLLSARLTPAGVKSIAWAMRT